MASANQYPVRREHRTESTNEDDVRTASFKQIDGSHVPINSNLDERIVMVLELMIASPMKSVSVPATAAVLHLSPSRLRHLFKEQVGIPLHKYEVLLRLERVRMLLRTTDCTVKEASRILGFKDTGNFGHLFKRTYGVTPGSDRTVKVARRPRRKDTNATLSQ
jgi:AraC-like DNA-binding protein